MMDIQPVSLIGERAQLVPLELSHVPGLFEAGRDPEIWCYMPVQQMQCLSAMEQLVQTALAARDAGTEFPFVILDQETDRIAGSTRFLDISVPNRSLEIGWTWLSPAVWRTRINTECKYLLLQHCFETLGAIRVQLKTDARNERSQRAMERIGAVREGVLRHHRILPNGFIRDSVYYSIIAEEWPGVKTRLESLLGAFPKTGAAVAD